MKNDPRVVVHLVKLIDTADAPVGKDEGTRLKDELLRLGVLRDVHSQADSRTALA